MPEVYDEFIKGIGTLYLDDISGANNIDGIGSFISRYGVDFFIKQTGDAFEMRCTSGGVKLADLDLNKYTKLDNNGGAEFDWNIYKETIIQVIKEKINNLKIEQLKNKNKEVISAATVDTTLYNISLKDLYGEQDKKTSDPYYKGFVSSLGGDILLNNTKLSPDGLQMRYMLGKSTFFGERDPDRTYLKRYVAIKDITDGNGNFDQKKWKTHLATVIDDCVTQYKAKNKKLKTTEPIA